jgi:hypothetical protein
MQVALNLTCRGAKIILRIYPKNRKPFEFSDIT